MKSVYVLLGGEVIPGAPRLRGGVSLRILLEDVLGGVLGLLEEEDNDLRICFREGGVLSIPSTHRLSNFNMSA